MLYYESEKVVGVANSEVIGNGITSSEAEAKKLVAVYFKVSARQDNAIRLWYEREKTLEILDQVLQLTTDPHTIRLEVGKDIPVGKDIKAAINCGAVATDVNVVYEYEITS